jgi:hypothetical protein
MEYLANMKLVIGFMIVWTSLTLVLLRLLPLLSSLLFLHTRTISRDQSAPCKNALSVNLVQDVFVGNKDEMRNA